MRHSDRPQPRLGKAIRQLRKQRNATQEEIAEAAGITGPTLSLVERGYANPTWATVEDIARALDVSVSELARAAERFEQG
ncbi:MAG TPA: helix-turn-helix transcriptional regulator [Solirubrobacterales bacterium]